MDSENRKHLKKKPFVLILCYFVIGAFLTIWLFSLIKCEVLTLLHAEEFTDAYQANTMIGNQKYWKIIEYTDCEAVVYFVEESNSFGNVLSFYRQNGEWTYDQWVETVWSKTGSADGFIWPYGR